MVEALKTVPGKHRWRVRAEGPLIVTRCDRCGMLFRTFWESHDRAKCEEEGDGEDQGPQGAD